MGTRADYYIGPFPDAEWLGSIAWDGDPEAQPKAVLGARSPTEFSDAVKAMLAGRRDATTPEQGWPWPWENSRLTDFAYAFLPEQGEVMASCFGRGWFDPKVDQTEELEEHGIGQKMDCFPDMSARRNLARGSLRSGVFIISRLGLEDEAP